MLARAASSVLVLLLMLTPAACGSSGATGGAVTVSGAWVRAAPSGAVTAAYLTITNTTAAADALVGVSTPAARSAGLHRTSTDSSGMTGMEPTAAIHVPAGGTSTLEPGGFHVMLIGLTGDLVAGQTVELTLTFERAGTLTVAAEIRTS